jgi:hypothetical protein
MIYPLINQIKAIAIQDPLVNMASYGDLQLFNNKSTIKYPYVNLDIVNSNKNGGSKKYTIRIYVVDRQYDNTVAHNKCELILDQLMKNLEITNYTTNFIVEEFNDIASGVWADVVFEIGMSLGCNFLQLFRSNNDYILLEDNDYVMNEEGDLIMLEQPFNKNLVYYGPLDVEPTSLDDLKRLENIVFYQPEKLDYKLDTGNVYKKFIIAIPNEKILDLVLDENAMYADITRTYIQKTMTIKNNSGVDVDYNVYTMSNAIPYTRNHKHAFTFVNNQN